MCWWCLQRTESTTAAGRETQDILHFQSSFIHTRRVIDAPGNLSQRSWPCTLISRVAQGTACTPRLLLNTWLEPYWNARTAESVSWPSCSGSHVCPEDVTCRCSRDTDKLVVERSTDPLQASARLECKPYNTILPVHDGVCEETSERGADSAIAAEQFAE
jgi:hypothetical protein